MINLNEYQEFCKSTAVYPDVGMGTPEEFMYLGLGLTGESGEVAEHAKKWYRDGQLFEDKVKKELGDVLWYCAMVANFLNVSLEEVVQMNVDKLTVRKEQGKLHGSGSDR